MAKGVAQIATNFAKIRAKLQHAMQELPTVIGNEIVNHSLEAFEKKSWEGKAWDKRKGKKDQARALLVKSGRLKRSIRVIRTTYNSVTVGTDVPYARVHNDGLTIDRAARSETFIRPRYERGKKKGTFRKLTREQRSAAPAQGFSFKAYRAKMPERRFLGKTKDLKQRVREVSVDHINKRLR